MNILLINVYFPGEIYLKWLQLRYYYLALTPDVVTLLDRLHSQYMLGLITNGPSAAQWEKIERLNLKSFFDIILVSGDLPWEKPQQQIFHEACEYLGVEPRQCLMVGDKLETDILGGIHAKLGATVWIPLSSDDQINDFGPDYTIEKVTDLPSLLPKNTGKLGNFRRPKNGFSRLNHNLDLDDCNSNSSDGS